jgi:hypothetical protein
MNRTIIKRKIIHFLEAFVRKGQNMHHGNLA